MIRLSLMLTSLLTLQFSTAPAMAEEGTATGPDLAVSENGVPQRKKTYSPYANTEHPNRVLWGETHAHTSYSWDAGLVGCNLDPGDAYRFAKGEQVVASSGQPVKLVRPLDWLVVADHAESLGVAVLGSSYPKE